jgi:hypothetical protein
VELTPKHAARTAQIMTALAAPGGYARVLYLTAPAARPAITRAAASLPPNAAPVTVRDLPEIAAAPAPRITGKRGGKTSAALSGAQENISVGKRSSFT